MKSHYREREFELSVKQRDAFLAATYSCEDIDVNNMEKISNMFEALRFQ